MKGRGSRTYFRLSDELGGFGVGTPVLSCPTLASLPIRVNAAHGRSAVRGRLILSKTDWEDLGRAAGWLPIVPPLPPHDTDPDPSEGAGTPLAALGAPP